MWEIFYTDEFGQWLTSQERDVRVRVIAHLELLSQVGPTLGRPHADTIKDSTLSNLKELRVQVGGSAYRIFYAFDESRTGLVLCGGRKGQKRFYKEMIATAQTLFDRYQS